MKKKLKRATVGSSREICCSNRETRRFDEKLGDSRENRESWEVWIAQSLSGENFIVWDRWKSILKARSIRLLYSSGEILELVAWSLFTINDQAKRALDCNSIMYVI